jgi:hypothetical protein
LFNRPEDSASVSRPRWPLVWRLVAALACLAIAAQVWRLLSFE